MVEEKARFILAVSQSQSRTQFEGSVIQHLDVEKASTDNGRAVVEFRLPVLQKLANHGGTLHGGAVATLIDLLTVITIWAIDPNPRTMSSIELSASYVSAAKVGEEVQIVTRCDKIGKRIAFASAELFVGNRLVATGRHTLSISNQSLLQTSPKL